MKINVTKPIETSKSESKRDYKPIPKGQYLAALTKVEEVTASNGNGVYLDTTFTIIEGEYKKRLVFHKFHLENKSAKCQEIGQDQLNRFLKCVGAKDGLASIGYDTTELSKFMDKLVAINVDIAKGTNGYADRNKITSFAMR